MRVRIGGSHITNVHARKMEELSRRYDKKVFEHYTTEGIGYSEASEIALPVFLVSGANAGRVSDQYRAIAEELLRRVPA